MRQSTEELAPEYLEFLKLYERGCYFKCHDVLEELWMIDRQDFYKGLIQVAVAMHHLENRNVTGCHLLMETASELLSAYRPIYLGMDVEQLVGILTTSGPILRQTPMTFAEARKRGLLPMQLPTA